MLCSNAALFQVAKFSSENTARHLPRRVLASTHSSLREVAAIAASTQKPKESCLPRGCSPWEHARGCCL